MPTPDLRRILIADDDADIRKLLRDSLESEAPGMRINDLEIIEVADGAEAILSANAQRFHCVITDLKMPRVRGDEFLRAMQANPLNANTPTLVVSGYLHDEFKDFCDSFSNVRVIPKPFEAIDVARVALQEVKLGRMDDKISIHLVQPFLDALQSWMAADLGLQAMPGAPSIKRAGVGLKGDHHSCLTLSTGLTRARFCLSFDDSLLAFAKAHLKSADGSDWLQLSAADATKKISTLIFERARAAIEPHMGAKPKLAMVEFYSSTVPADIEEMACTTGVTVEVTSGKGRIYTGAFSISTAKRA